MQSYIYLRKAIRPLIKLLIFNIIVMYQLIAFPVKLTALVMRRVFILEKLTCTVPDIPKSINIKLNLLKTVIKSNCKLVSHNHNQILEIV